MCVQENIWPEGSVYLLWFINDAFSSKDKACIMWNECVISE